MKIPLLENCSENCQTSSDFMLFIYLQAWLWYLTKLPRIYDSDDGCNYADSVNYIPLKQFTTVPFSLLLTGLTTTLDINGELSWAESLEKVIVELLKVSGGGTPLVPADETGTFV